MKTETNKTSGKHPVVIWAMVVISALAISGYLLLHAVLDHKPVSHPQKVTIAYSASTDAILAEVAQVQGYYLQEGLEVTPHLHPYGKLALRDVLEGKADFATVAETPIMFAIMNGEKISVIATIHTSSKGNAIIARKDMGVATPNDLEGRKIAATFGTTSEFFLDAFLVGHGISRNDIEVVDLKPAELMKALANGDVDAISTFNPYTILMQRELGEKATIFHDEDLYTWTFNIVATQEFISKNPEKVTKVLRALVKAEEYAERNPANAQKIVSEFSGMDMDMVGKIWADAKLIVTLDQTLVLALEEESRWAINRGLASNRYIPNYLEYIYITGLQAVKPEAVRILR